MKPNSPTFSGSSCASTWRSPHSITRTGGSRKDWAPRYQNPEEMLSTLLLGVFCMKMGSTVSPEQDQARAWVSAKFESRSIEPGPPAQPYDSVPPFSFDYGGKPFAELVKGWKVERSSEKIDSNRTRRTVLYTDPGTGLEVKCVAVEYADFPTVEWTVYLTNKGSNDTPMISNLQGIDTDLRRPADTEFTLNHWNGSQAGPRDFEPLTTPLPSNAHLTLGTTGGRPTQGSMPYFNLRRPGAGLLIAIGWPGQWAADFQCDAGQGLRIKGGQELTHFVLHPGEHVRTPLTALQFTDGSLEGAQNVWRRWFLAYNTPHIGGKPLPAQHVACSSHQFGEMIHANEQNQKEFIDDYLAHGFKLDYWWMDAGWYPNDGSWGFTGTWEPDKKRFANGLRAVSDHAHKKDVKIIVWFEPERVHVRSWLDLNHPEWMLSIDGKGTGDQRLLNLGDPRACAWLTDHIAKLISSEGIDFYRQDYNIDPLPYWRVADAPDRQGITENRYVEGYLAYWDGLLKAHPGMPIDTCASGGKRLDLETLRRSVPLLRSDYIFEPVGQQGHTYGLSSWVPYQGSGHIEIDSYLLRSVMLSSINTCWDVRRKDLDYSLARKLMAEWRSVAACFLGDYYPLTSYSVAADQWIGWQYDLPSERRGVVQVFRHADSPYESARLKLHGLDPKAKYEVKDLDAARASVLSGRELMEEGLLVTLRKSPGAAMISYRKVK